jgi:hypothetical protein
LFRLAKFLLEALSSGIEKINNNDSGTESYRSFDENKSRQIKSILAGMVLE